MKGTMLKKTKKPKDHIIICGLGATAMQIIELLESHREQPSGKGNEVEGVSYHEYLVIDSSEEAIERTKIKWPKIHCIIGDATDDDVLEEARIRDAYGIFPVLSSEKDNLYITMAARQLNSRIRIVARTADVVNTGKKLFKGGANSVVSPNFIGGLRLVSEMVRPHVTEFLDEMMNHKNIGSEMAEIVMSKESPFCGLSLKEASLPNKYGILVIAMRKRGDPVYTYNPSGSTPIEHADTIVVLGSRDQIDKLTKQADAF
jgi:voltage-gated potassium channel